MLGLILALVAVWVWFCLVNFRAPAAACLVGFGALPLLMLIVLTFVFIWFEMQARKLCLGLVDWELGE